MRKLEKKGVSSVVATMFLIAMAVVIAGIVWAVVNGMIKKSTEESESCFGVFDKLTINDGKTCYEKDKGKVRIYVNSQDLELDKMLISVSGEKYSKTFEIAKEPKGAKECEFDNQITEVDYYFADFLDYDDTLDLVAGDGWDQWTYLSVVKGWQKTNLYDQLGCDEINPESDSPCVEPHKSSIQNEGLDFYSYVDADYDGDKDVVVGKGNNIWTKHFGGINNDKNDLWALNEIYDNTWCNAPGSNNIPQCVNEGGGNLDYFMVEDFDRNGGLDLKIGAGIIQWFWNTSKVGSELGWEEINLENEICSGLDPNSVSYQNSPCEEMSQPGWKFDTYLEKEFGVDKDGDMDLFLGKGTSGWTKYSANSNWEVPVSDIFNGWCAKYYSSEGVRLYGKIGPAILPEKNSGLVYYITAPYDKFGEIEQISLTPVVNGNRCEKSDELNVIDECGVIN